MKHRHLALLALLPTMLIITACARQETPDMRATQELHVQSGDATLYVRRIGQLDASEVLIATDMGPGFSSHYMASLEQLAGQSFAVVTYDQRGTGRSSEPSGQFEMGSDAIWRWSRSLREDTLMPHPFADVRPQHAVYLDAFWMDQTEVTVGMFRTFVEATGYVAAAEREGYGQPYKPGPREEEWPDVPGADWQHPRGPGSDAQDDHPLVQVTWDDAAAYCQWAGGQLPTEAQWEKACRGTDARAYPWGNEFDERRLNYCDARCPVTRWTDPSFDDDYAYTSPVGSYPAGASPYGTLDMAGNVWEWTADHYNERYYASSPYENPRGPDTGVERVQHGGAWLDSGHAGWLACTARHATRPGTTADDLGFRCAVTAEG